MRTQANVVYFSLLGASGAWPAYMALGAGRSAAVEAAGLGAEPVRGAAQAAAAVAHVVLAATTDADFVLALADAHADDGVDDAAPSVAVVGAVAGSAHALHAADSGGAEGADAGAHARDAVLLRVEKKGSRRLEIHVYV